MITSECVNCGVCEPECPNGAIAPADPVFAIDPEVCTECVGHFARSQCVDVCPVDCILPDSGRVETRAELQAKLDRMIAQGD